MTSLNQISRTAFGALFLMIAATAGVAAFALDAPVTAAAGEWIETVFSETVPLVAPASAAPSIKTHKPDRTFTSPNETRLGGADETHPATGQSAARPLLCIFPHRRIDSDWRTDS